MLVFSGCGKKEEVSYVRQAMTLIENMQYEEAVTALVADNAMQESKKLSNRGLGLAYMGMEQYEEAIPYFREALLTNQGIVKPVDYDINYYLAVCHYKLGQIEDALSIYNAILALEPEEKEAIYYTAIMQLELNELDKACKSFDQLLAKEPSNYELKIQIFEQLKAYGFEDKGREYLEATITESAKSMTDAQKGVIYYYLEDYQQARDNLERARSNGEEKTISFLGKTHEALGDFNYACTVYEEYVSKNPTSAKIANQLAVAKMKIGDYEDAIATIQEALQLDTNEFTQALQFNEIVAYEYQGEFKKAAVLMEQYLQLYPNDREAIREYEFLRTR